MKLSDLYNLESICPNCKAKLTLAKLEWGASMSLSEVKPGTKITCWDCGLESPAKSFNLEVGK